MNLDDLRDQPEGALIETDLCIAGSGPAGLSLAKEFEGSSVRVLVLESGGLTLEPPTQALYEIENVGALRWIDQEVVRVRLFGGTSQVWSGRCAPFSPIDFEPRAWIPGSGWPLDPRSLDSYLDRAGAYLGLGPNVYDERLWARLGVRRPPAIGASTQLRSEFWQFSTTPGRPTEPRNFSDGFLAEAAPNVRVLLHANVTHITTNGSGTRLESLELSTLEGKRATVRPRVLVLCCGGIENARLLLASNRVLSAGVGNAHDQVGRCLMDHPLCQIGAFERPDGRDVRDLFGHYWLDDVTGRHVFLHGLALNRQIQANEQLLNCAAFIEEYPDEASSWLALRQLRTTWRSQRSIPALFRGATRVAARPQEILAGVSRRYLRRRPPLIKASRLVMHCMVEQPPDPQSRVTLSERKDALGMPLSRIDWQRSDLERRTVRRFAGLVRDELTRLGISTPSLPAWLQDERAEWVSCFADKAHPMGTTRMSADPRRGVVDPHGQVHGVEGLYIAGSSVFPTSGTANPTLMLMALTVRLADRLKATVLGP